MTVVDELRSRITYANVTATLALVLAMAGGAGAATLIAGPGKSESVTGCVKRNGVFTIPVSNPRNGKQAACRSGERSLRLARAPITINGDGLRGAAGPTGPAGPKGDAGTPDLSTVVRGRGGLVTSAAVAIPADILPHDVLRIPGIGMLEASGTTALTDFLLVNETDVTLAVTSTQPKAIEVAPGATGLAQGAAQPGTVTLVIERPATATRPGAVVHVAIGNRPAGGGAPAGPTKLSVQVTSADA